MNTNDTLFLSENAVLQNAIEILKKLNGSADLTQLYDGFADILGRKLTEVEAGNVKRVLDDSASRQTAAQCDGAYLYISTPDNQTYFLQEGVFTTDSQPGEKSGLHSMEQALNKKEFVDKKLTTPQHQTNTVTEPGILVSEDISITNEQQTGYKGPKDIQADTQARKDSYQFEKAEYEAKQKQIDYLEAVEKATNKIAKEEAKIQKHTEQIVNDRTNLMKSLHRAEIRHDEKVIEKQKEKINDLNQKNNS